MKLFPAKISKRGTLQKSMTSEGNSAQFASGNIEILGKQNYLFPSRPVIKCLLKLKITFVHLALIQVQNLFETGLLEVTEGSQNSGIAVCRETQETHT